jgi:ABC-type cobalamin/Fe3+-siderophores transport system ATPase subunit
MKLILKNIGMLENAEVTLHPLCVIAGENDNGKSTIGKIVFCIIKAINRYKEDLLESKEHLIGDKSRELYFLLRSSLTRTSSDVDEVLRLLRRFSVQNISIDDQLVAIDSAIDKAFEVTDLDPDAKEQIKRLRNEIDAIAHQPEDTRQSIENAFNKVFASEFDASLLLHSQQTGTIQLFEGDLELIHLRINKDGNVALLTDVEPVEIQDATFIDSPLILNYHDVLSRSQTLLDLDKRRPGRIGMSYTTLHTKDLFDKLREPALPNNLFTNDRSSDLNLLKYATKGEVSYSKSEHDFVFKRNQQAFSIKNTASGIKVFGLLQILLGNEIIDKSTMLIFDEPENHLHPKWQLHLAQVLVSLVEHGVFVLVSSHSPYMIEALKRYGDRANLAESARFFLAENNRIEDRDRLSEIFQILSEPFETFREMDAEGLMGE